MAADPLPLEIDAALRATASARGIFGTRVFYVIQAGYDTHYAQLATHGRLLSELPCLLSCLALLTQSQNKRNEGNEGMLNTRAQGAHKIPNARRLLQHPVLA